MNSIRVISDSDGGIVGGIVRTLGPPVVVLLVSIVVFSYLVSIGKRRLGVVLGLLLLATSVGWFFINISN